jgi:ArsR family transcriptional regulator
MRLFEYKKMENNPLSPNLSQEICMMEAELCSAFSDPTRILILYELDEKPRMVNELAADLNVNQPTISRHLKILRDRGLVKAERQGTTMLYCLTDHRLIEALDLLRAVMRDRLVQRASLVTEVGI